MILVQHTKLMQEAKLISCWPTYCLLFSVQSWNNFPACGSFIHSGTSTTLMCPFRFNRWVTRCWTQTVFNSTMTQEIYILWFVVKIYNGNCVFGEKRLVDSTKTWDFTRCRSSQKVFCYFFFNHGARNLNNVIVVDIYNGNCLFKE